jgi:hypothetical protein
MNYDLTYMHALVARAEAETRWVEWLSQRDFCCCAEPLPARRYLGWWSCALCGRLESRRIVADDVLRPPRPRTRPPRSCAIPRGRERTATSTIHHHQGGHS